MKLPVWSIVFVAPLFIAPLLFSQTAAAESNQTLDKLMLQWLEIESQKGRLQSEWSLRKAELDQRLNLMNIEQTALTEIVVQGSKATNDVDQRRLSLLQSQDKLELEQTQVDSQIQTTTTLIQALKIKLPPPLQSEWNEKLPLLLQKGVSNSEKLERILSLLKLVEDFNNRVALNRTTMTLPNSQGETVELLVTQFYLGTAQGWYVSDDGAVYGYGRATALGWTWWHNQDASKELGRALNPKTLLALRAILENPTSATFISLPIKI